MPGALTVPEVLYCDAGEIADQWGAGWYIFWHSDIGHRIFRGPFTTEGNAEQYKNTKLRHLFDDNASASWSWSSTATMLCRSLKRWLWPD
jgi:hypothetical protein